MAHCFLMTLMIRLVHADIYTRTHDKHLPSYTQGTPLRAP